MHPELKPTEGTEWIFSKHSRLSGFYSDSSLSTTALLLAGNQMREMYAQNICNNKTWAKAKGDNCPWQSQPSWYRPRGWDLNSPRPCVSKCLQAPSGSMLQRPLKTRHCDISVPPVRWVLCLHAICRQAKGARGRRPVRASTVCVTLIYCPATVVLIGIHRDGLRPNGFIW